MLQHFLEQSILDSSSCPWLEWRVSEESVTDDIDGFPSGTEEIQLEELDRNGQERRAEVVPLFRLNEEQQSSTQVLDAC